MSKQNETRRGNKNARATAKAGRPRENANDGVSSENKTESFIVDKFMELSEKTGLKPRALLGHALARPHAIF